MNAPDYGDLIVFRAVARWQSFSQAAEHLGVTRSAVSQTIRKLEERLSLALFQRTTRSVSLTPAGQALIERLAPALDDIDAALASVVDRSDNPSGVLRLAVTSIAKRFLSGSYLAGFLARYPDVRLDLTVTDDAVDIVAEGYDAGVQLGEVIARDMVAVPIGQDVRQLAVCSPDYAQRHGVPQHPRDLVQHRCIGWRPAPDSAPYRWEFADQGVDVRVDVDPEITANTMEVMVELAKAGAGITFGMEASFDEAIARGELVPLLEAYCPYFPGFFLHYPSRRHAPPKLRALIDYVLENRA